MHDANSASCCQEPYLVQYYLNDLQVMISVQCASWLFFIDIMCHLSRQERRLRSPLILSPNFCQLLIT